MTDSLMTWLVHNLMAHCAGCCRPRSITKPTSRWSFSRGNGKQQAEREPARDSLDGQNGDASKGSPQEPVITPAADASLGGRRSAESLSAAESHQPSEADPASPSANGASNGAEQITDKEAAKKNGGAPSHRRHRSWGSIGSVSSIFSRQKGRSADEEVLLAVSHAPADLVPACGDYAGAVP